MTDEMGDEVHNRFSNSLITIDEMIDNTTVNGISLRELQKEQGNASKLHLSN